MRKLSLPAWLPIHADWIRHFTRVQLRIIAIVTTFLCFALLEMIHWLVAPRWRLEGDYVLPDIVASLLLGILVSRVLSLAWERRQMLLQRLDVIAEMNHHIRNALEMINLSAHQTHDPEAIKRISEASNRIQWALREILPQDVQDQKDGQLQERRNAGRRNH
ncbi:MAG TPA: hypothetical protein VN622_12130 [Clostridia bacterium]|nr:hypothetical protein [Clostridia bacterium]